MSNLREIDIKNPTHCFLYDIISIKNLDPNIIKTDKKSDNSVLCYYIFCNEKDYDSEKKQETDAKYVIGHKTDKNNYTIIHHTSKNTKQTNAFPLKSRMKNC